MTGGMQPAAQLAAGAATGPPAGPATGARAAAWLARPVSGVACAVAWCLATLLFVGLTFAWTGALTERDANLVDVPAASIAHGQWHCGFEVSNTPPLYPLLVAGYASALHVGAGTPFPLPFPHESCLDVSWQQENWLSDSHAAGRLLPASLLVWPVLLAGFVGLLRASKRGRTRLEIVGVCLLGLIPQLGYCFSMWFHPAEILALGLGLASLALVFSNRWALGGVAAGLAVAAHQLGLLVVLVLLLVAPRPAYRRLVPACALTILVVCLPVIVLSKGGAISGMVFNGVTELHFGSLVSSLPLRGFMLAVLSRGSPFVGTLVAGLLLRRSLGTKVTSPHVAVTLLVLASMLRLTFEVAMFGYYLAWAAVTLLALDLVVGRLRLVTLGWIVGSAIIFPPVPPVNYPFSQLHPVPAQAVVVFTGLALVLVELRSFLRNQAVPDPGVVSTGPAAARVVGSTPGVTVPAAGAPSLAGAAANRNPASLQLAELVEVPEPSAPAATNDP